MHTLSETNHAAALRFYERALDAKVLVAFDLDLRLQLCPDEEIVVRGDNKWLPTRHKLEALMANRLYFGNLGSLRWRRLPEEECSSKGALPAGSASGRL